jgi:hypothetical protein
MELSAAILQETLTKVKSDKGNGNAARRARPRVGLRCSLMIIPYSNGACRRPLKAWTRDISLGGMGILTSLSMKSGDQFIVQLPKADSKPLILLCTVKNCVQLADGLYGVGVSFAEVVRKEESAPALPIDQAKAADIQRISQAILH